MRNSSCREGGEQSSGNNSAPGLAYIPLPTCLHQQTRNRFQWTRQSTFWDFNNIQCTISWGPEQNQKAEPWRRKGPQEYYYCYKLAMLEKNACKLLSNQLRPSLIDSVSEGTSSVVRPVQNVIFTQTFSDRIIGRFMPPGQIYVGLISRTRACTDYYQKDLEDQ